jgi:hypothetical protein
MKVIPALKFYVTVGDSNVGPTTPIRQIYQLTLLIVSRIGYHHDSSVNIR